MQAADLDAFAQTYGYCLGWRFLMCPEQLIDSAAVAVVTLNPGGSQEHGTAWSFERGNAYWDESWRGKPAGASDLQRQIQRMSELACISKHDLLSGYYVPFRSPSWAALPHAREAKQFASKLWTGILRRSPAQTIICVGKAVTASGIASILNAPLVDSLAAGWEGQSIDIYKAVEGRKVIALPHLSRFQLMHRPPSEAAFLRALAA